MHRQTYLKLIWIILILSSMMALATAPALSQNGNGQGQGKGQGRGQQEQQSPPEQEQEPAQEHTPPGQNKNREQEQAVPEASTQQQEQQEELLGCQKNNPDRLDCSSLEVTGYCDGAMAVFIITNTGEQGDGDMAAATSYQLLQNGSVIESGSMQLDGGQSGLVTYSGGGEVTLIVNQQVGHPGSSQPRITLSCSEVIPTEEVTPTEDVTPEPTPTEEVTPTEEPTPEVTPTEEVSPPELYASAACDENGAVVFYVSNAGAPMTEPVYYTITDADGYLIQSDWLLLDTNEVVAIDVGQLVGAITLDIDNGLVVESVTCYVPTEEVEPPGDPNLIIFPYCEADGAVVFEIVNTGSDMAQEVYYYVADFDGNVVAEGWLQLASDESMMLNIGVQSGRMTLVIGDWLAYSVIECFVSTEEPTPTEEVTPEPTPTEEVTPEPTPTEEVTPEPTPTEEVTPEPTPTEEVTPPPALGCQQNNPDRLDCSSLEVSAYCEGDVAVFVIRNTGEAGNGDMVQATEYRLIQGDTVIESGSVQLSGEDTMIIRYDGGGEVTLEADQQIGHPGQSQPQATLNCGS